MGIFHRTIIIATILIVVCVLLNGCCNCNCKCNKDNTQSQPTSVIQDKKQMYSLTMKASALTNLQNDESASSVGEYINMMTLAERRVQTYIELMKTESFYQQIADVSGTGYSADAVESMLDFERIEGTGFFYITITDTDQQAVTLIRDALVQEMKPYVKQHQSNAELTVIEPGRSVPVE